jgi:ribonuclease HI
MKNTIIQWNCRGLKANYNDILLLLNEYDPALLCLQETFLKDTDNITFKNYSLFNTYLQNVDRASGGVSIAVNNRAPHRTIPLNTNLQAIAVSVTLHRVITFCSIYIPPNTKLSPNELDTLVQQLPTPFVLLGDFNAHNILWGSNYISDRGKIVEDFVTRHDLCLFNSKSPTYLHPGTGTYTCIDLTICSASLLLDYNWKVADDLHSSDHFPIYLKNTSAKIDDTIPQWKLKKADWVKFETLCTIRINSNTILNDDDPIRQFTSILIEIAEESIPKSSPNCQRTPKPWFTKECKEAIKQRREALKKFNNHPTPANLTQYRITRAKTRRTIKESKRTSWKKYVSTLNSRSSINKVWDTIRKINGKSKYNCLQHLKLNNINYKSKHEIANVLADCFSKNSSSSNYSEAFRRLKTQKEKTRLKFTSNNLESYNQPFSLSELMESLNKANDTSAGPDDIHYQFLKHLPEPSLTVLLEIFNDLWITGNVPKIWKEAIIIPIPKPGKDNADPTNYRPISLTSCVCKTLERMINSRLVWYLESNNLISPFQSGFRHGRSTNDHLVRLETFIRDAFIKREHLVAVFFDLEKAYDTTWKYGILNDLHDLGLKGRLPSFILNFLSDREFKVRVGSTLSDIHDQETGVPQGSILSVTLFNIKINSITKCLTPGVDCSLYVDDFLICYRSKHMHTIERQLQININKIQNWANTNGFKFSKSKTVCMHFCQLRRHHDGPNLTLEGTPIPVVEETKFLGIIFDRKLTFIPHLKHLKAKCLKSLNLLKVIAHTDWGADRRVILSLYRTFIRSKLDYGCVVYGSARKSYLKMLDPIHHQGIRLALGAFKTSPCESLLVEADEPPLSQRREMLSAQYATKLRSSPLNPAFSAVFEPKYKTLYDNKPNVIPTFGIRISKFLENTQIDLSNILKANISETPPWLLQQPRVLFTLHDGKKSETHPSIFHNSYLELLSQFENYTKIYTDGSKDEDKAAAAFVSGKHTTKVRLPNGTSIFSAEIRAIDLALQYVASKRISNSIIFSDSLSVLQSLHNRKLENALLVNILVKHTELSTFHNIVYCWLPSHVGIKGNDKADRAAKMALLLEPTDFKTPYTDFKRCIKDCLRQKWQASWNDALNNKLHAIKPTLGEWTPSYRSVRREEVVIARIRLGHTHLTHSYILKGEDPPECISCNEPFTVKHFMLECFDLQPTRNHYYVVQDMRELFDTVSITNIIDFLKEVNIYYKL